MLTSFPQFSLWPPRTNRARPASVARHVDATVVFDDDVAERAYQKFLARGSVHGFDRQDWVEAQRELVAEIFRQ
jgi:DUF2934 family protein